MIQYSRYMKQSFLKQLDQLRDQLHGNAAHLVVYDDHVAACDYLNYGIIKPKRKLTCPEPPMHDMIEGRVPHMPPFATHVGPPHPEVVKTWVTPESYEAAYGELVKQRWASFSFTVAQIAKLPYPFNKYGVSVYTARYTRALQGDVIDMMFVDHVSTAIAVLRLKHII